MISRARNADTRCLGRQWTQRFHVTHAFLFFFRNEFPILGQFFLAD